MFCQFLYYRRDLRPVWKGQSWLVWFVPLPFPGPSLVPSLLPQPHLLHTRWASAVAPPRPRPPSRLRSGEGAGQRRADTWRPRGAGRRRAWAGIGWGSAGRAGGRRGDGCRALASARACAAWGARRLGEGDGSSMAAGCEPPNPPLPHCRRRRRRSRWDSLVCVC